MFFPINKTSEIRVEKKNHNKGSGLHFKNVAYNAISDNGFMIRKFVKLDFSIKKPINS